MKVVLFGATGMIGQGVLRECLAAADVTRVLTIGRQACGTNHPKLAELVRQDLFDYSDLGEELRGYDACFFCLGVTSSGMSEAQYHRITVELTQAAARALLAASPSLTFVFVTGIGTDSSERGSIMWARVKGKAENMILAMGFKAAYMIRPGYIQPLHGIRSRTRLYRAFYAVIGPIYPLLAALLPNQLTTTEKLGRAMLALVRHGTESVYLENRHINQLAALT